MTQSEECSMKFRSIIALNGYFGRLLPSGLPEQVVVSKKLILHTNFKFYKCAIKSF